MSWYYRRGRDSRGDLVVEKIFFLFYTLELSEKQKQMFNRPSIGAIFPNHYIIKVNDFDDNARDTLDQWVYFLKNSEIKDEFNAKGMAAARRRK